VLTALFGAAGYALGGSGGMTMGLLFAGVMNFGAYWWSDKIVLSIYRAKPVSEKQEPKLFRTVARLASGQGLPMPALYIIPQDAPNAFATGRNPSHAAVAVTRGLLEILNPRELEGVLSHELGHVKNRDTLVSTIAATLAGALSMLAELTMWRAMLGGRHGDGEDQPHPLFGLLGMLVAPLAGMLIQAAISRSREFLADETGGRATGDPMALASALQKIETWAKRVPLEVGTPATAHLFIVNPFAGRRVLSLFSTHPPTRERVKRLERLATQQFGIGV
jgi:heat shock protein HtpX